MTSRNVNHNVTCTIIVLIHISYISYAEKCYYGTKQQNVVSNKSQLLSHLVIVRNAKNIS